ncbi:MAG: helix-turn-helix domain-containing protein [Desertimonas sp.]
MYADEELLRSLMSWVLPDADRVLPGLHPQRWDGSALVLDPDVAVLGQIEPLLRRMSVIADSDPPEVVASRLLTLFVQVVELVVPTLLAPGEQERTARTEGRAPVADRLVQPLVRAEVAETMRLLRTDMARRWTTRELAEAVSLSVSQLIRSFNVEVGTTPMRFLNETRLTEFARLVEETELPIGVAAIRVGWPDTRIASGWMRRRFGLAPAEYRRRTRPGCCSQNGQCGCRAEGFAGLRPAG